MRVKLINIVIKISGYFEKQTTHGWDHKVRVSLSLCQDKRVFLEWTEEPITGKEKKKMFELTKMYEAVLRTTNGKVVFKNKAVSVKAFLLNQSIEISGVAFVKGASERNEFFEK